MEDYIEDIGCAILYTKKLYKRICKRDAIIHFNPEEAEVEYHLLKFWVYSPHDFEVLCKLVHKATLKFPDAAPYISGDLIDKIPLDHTSTPILCWCHGYFCRICEEHKMPTWEVKLDDLISSLQGLIHVIDEEDEDE